MKNTAKKTLAILLSLVLMLGLMPGMSVTAYAQLRCPHCHSTNVEYDSDYDDYFCWNCHEHMEEPEDHTHSWQYNVDGSRVIAICPIDCGEVFNVLIHAPSNLVYNGSPKSATIETFPDPAPEGVPAVPTSISYYKVENGQRTSISGAPSEVGSYAASFTWGGKTASVSFTITAPNVAVTGVTLDKTSATLTVGGTETLTATVSPDNATNKSVTWTSSDTSVATVANGVVTAVAPGTATITVTSKADANKNASCSVTVNAPTVAVTGITLDKTSATLTVGGTETLTATVSPDNATDKSVTWTTSDASVATVADGVVTAVGEGEATITATATNGTDETDDDQTASCDVTVSAPAEVKVQISYMEASFGNAYDFHIYLQVPDFTYVPSLNVGGVRALTASTAAEYASNNVLAYTAEEYTNQAGNHYYDIHVKMFAKWLATPVYIKVMHGENEVAVQANSIDANGTVLKHNADYGYGYAVSDYVSLLGGDYAVFANEIAAYASHALSLWPNNQ